MKFIPLILWASPTTALTATQLFQFSNKSVFVENLAVRPNGNLLLTTFSDNNIYTLDPAAKKPVPQIIAQVPGSTGLTGIVEVAQDIYAISAGVVNDTETSFQPGTSKVALVNMRDCPNAASVKIAARVPNAGILNGMASLPKHENIILSADSKTGRIYRVNTSNGTVDIAFQDDRLTPGPKPKLIPLGINGIKVFNGYLYLTNSEQRFVGRIKINEFGNKSGNLEIITTLPPDPPKFLDDFSIARDGKIYLGIHTNTLAQITPDGNLTSLFEGNSAGFFLDEPTATAFSKDEKTLYVTTGGGGQTGKGGQIVSVKL